MKHPDLKTVKADVDLNFKTKVKERAKLEGKCETEIVVKALRNYLDTPLRRK